MGQAAPVTNAPPRRKGLQGSLTSSTNHCMAEENMIATRVTKPLYEKILRRQREVKRLTGIEPSVSAVLRSMIAEAPEKIRIGAKRRAAGANAGG